MAYEKMQRSFTCRCGKGRMIAEWEEHDTWVSPNRSITWSFDCPDCTEKYEFYDELASRRYVISKTDAEKLRSLKGDRAASDALWDSIDKVEVPFK